MNKIIASRRGFIAGIAALIAAPAIVRAASLMPVKVHIINPFEELLYRGEGTFRFYSGYEVLHVEPEWVAQNFAMAGGALRLALVSHG